MKRFVLFFAAVCLCIGIASAQEPVKKTQTDNGTTVINARPNQQHSCAHACGHSCGNHQQTATNAQHQGCQGNHGCAGHQHNATQTQTQTQEKSCNHSQEAQSQQKQHQGCNGQHSGCSHHHSSANTNSNQKTDTKK